MAISVRTYSATSASLTSAAACWASSGFYVEESEPSAASSLSSSLSSSSSLPRYFSLRASAFYLARALPFALSLSTSFFDILKAAWSWDSAYNYPSPPYITAAAIWTRSYSVSQVLWRPDAVLVCNLAAWESDITEATVNRIQERLICCSEIFVSFKLKIIYWS